MNTSIPREQREGKESCLELGGQSDTKKWDKQRARRTFVGRKAPNRRH